MSPHADLRALDDDFFNFVLAVNLRGPFATVRACRHMLEASGQGLVVNVGSVSGVRGDGSNIAYAAAKAGLHAMTMSGVVLCDVLTRSSEPQHKGREARGDLMWLKGN